MLRAYAPYLIVFKQSYFKDTAVCRRKINFFYLDVTTSCSYTRRIWY